MKRKFVFVQLKNVTNHTKMATIFFCNCKRIKTKLVFIILIFKNFKVVVCPRNFFHCPAAIKSHTGRVHIFKTVCTQLGNLIVGNRIFVVINNIIDFSKVGNMTENRRWNIVKQPRNCLRLVVGKMPDNQGNANAVIKARIIKTVSVQLSPVGSAQKSYALKPLQKRQLNIFFQKLWKVRRKDFVIFFNVVFPRRILRKHFLPGERFIIVISCHCQSFPVFLPSSFFLHKSLIIQFAQSGFLAVQT